MIFPYFYVLATVPLVVLEDFWHLHTIIYNLLFWIYNSSKVTKIMASGCLITYILIDFRVMGIGLIP